MRTFRSYSLSFVYVVVQSLSPFWLFATPWTAAHQLLCRPLWPEFAQIHVQWVSDVTEPSDLLLPPSLFASVLPRIRIFPLSPLFASGGWSFGASASAKAFTVLPVNIQCWFPLGLTGLITLPSKGLSRVFLSTTVWKHHFFSTQPSLWSRSHSHTWLLEKP